MKRQDSESGPPTHSPGLGHQYHCETFGSEFPDGDADLQVE
jgi:hypothetical protein